MLICLFGEKEFAVKEIRKSFLFCNFEKLSNFSFTVPFKVTRRNLKLIERILLNEARRFFPQYKEVPFGFHLSEDEVNRFRCYVVDPEEYDFFVSTLLANRSLPRKIYPFFAVLYAYTKRYKGKNKLIVFVDGLAWYIYAFQGKEMVFQRFIRGEGRGYLQDLLSQLEVVMAHLVQHLRFKPDIVLFLGEETPEQVTLSVPSVVERVSLDRLLKEAIREGTFSDYLIRFPRLEAEWRLTKVFKIAGVVCLLLFVSFSSYGYLKLRQLHKSVIELEGLGASALSMWEEVEEGLRVFREGKFGAWFELLKLRASVPDTRRMIAQVSFLSEIEGVKVERVVLKPQEKVLILEGEVPFQDFQGRQRTFSRLLGLLRGKGMQVKAFDWDLIGGDFKIELTFP